MQEFEKNLTHKSTPEARRLGEILQGYGWRVEFEKFDGHNHIDIAIPEAKVDIEVDGHQHTADPEQALSDLERMYYSFRRGYLTLRISNVLVRDPETIQTTADFIDKFLRANEEQIHTHFFRNHSRE